MSEERRPTPWGVWSRRAALFGLAVIVCGIVFHRLFGMPTGVALNLFALGFGLAALALLLAAIAIVVIWRRGVQGMASVVVGVVVGGGILCWPLSVVPKLRALPEINDLTTDVADPPAFKVLAVQRPPGANPARYPGVATASAQKAFYTELQPLVLNRSAEEAFDLSRQALRRLRMVIVNEEPVGTIKSGQGLIEAYDRTLVLGFYDDVAVRVTAQGRAARIDIRSASRYGRHDLGRNAQRIRDILNEIVARADTSVPGQGARKGKRDR